MVLLPLGHADCVSLPCRQWARKEQICWDPAAITTSAVRALAWPALDWLASEGCLDTFIVTWEATVSMNDVLWAWAMARGVPMSDALTMRAAERDVAMVRWLRERGCSWHKGTSMRFCARYGGQEVWDLQAMQWAIRDGCTWHPSASCTFIAAQRMPELRWAIAAGCPWDPDSVLDFMNSCACRCPSRNETNGTFLLEGLRWALQNGAPWHKDLPLRAAREADPRVLQLIISMGYPWHPRTSLALAGRGRVSTLRWAMAHGCTWHPETSIEAATNTGDVDVLRWALAHGCPWHNRTQITKAYRWEWATRFGDRPSPSARDALAIVGRPVRG